MSKVPYASAVGCLMYAMVSTRLDLAHAVSTVSKYMANPRRVLKYSEVDFQVLERHCGT
jgi:hypothetical protein